MCHYIDDQHESTFSLQPNFVIKPYVGVVVEGVGLLFRIILIFSLIYGAEGCFYNGHSCKFKDTYVIT